MNVLPSSFRSISNHRDLRCGMGLVQFQKVTDEFTSIKGLSTIKLGKILSLEYGVGLTEEERSGAGYPVVGSNGIVGYHDDYLVEGPCIVIGRKGSAGEVTYINEPCYPIDTTFFVKLKSDTFDVRFIYYMLHLLKLQRLALFKGVPGLNRYDAYEASIPFIAKPTQHKIMKSISPMEEEIEILEAKIKNPADAINRVFASEFGFNLDVIHTTKNKKIFTRLCKDLSGFPTLRVDFKFHKNMPVFDELLSRAGAFILLKDINLSTPMYGANEPGIDGDPGVDTRFIRITDIDVLGNLMNEEWKTAEIIEPKYFLKNGDFLFARSGNTVGKTFLYDAEKHPEAFFAGYFIRYELDFSSVLPLFLLYYTKSFLYDFWRNGIIRIKGQPNINADEYLTLKIPVLPKERQEHIIGEVQFEIQKMEGIKNQIAQKRSEIDRVIRGAIVRAGVTKEDKLH